MKRNIDIEIDKIKYLFEYKMGVTKNEQKALLKEYDIYDDNLDTWSEELKSDGGNDIMAEIGVTSDGLSSVKNLENELSSNTNIWSVCDNNHIDNKFRSVINTKFPGKVDEVIALINEYIEKFMVFLKDLSIKNLKQLFKDIKSKKSEADELMLSGDTSSKIVSEGIINEFFGTSMALITLFGGFAMPALVLSIAAITFVTLIGMWLIKMIFCKFNIEISIPYYGRAKCGKMGWGKKTFSCS